MRAGSLLDQDGLCHNTCCSVTVGSARPGHRHVLFKETLNAFNVVNGIFCIQRRGPGLRQGFMILVVEEFPCADVTDAVTGV